MLAEACRVWGPIEPGLGDRKLTHSLDVLLKITRGTSVTDPRGWATYVNANIQKIKTAKREHADFISSGLVQLYNTEFFGRG